MASKNTFSKKTIKISGEFLKNVHKYSLANLTTEKISQINISGTAKSKNGSVKALELLLNQEKSVYNALLSCQKNKEIKWLSDKFSESLANNGRIVFLGAGAKFREAVFLEREWNNLIKSLPAKIKNKLPKNLQNYVIGIGAGGDLAQIRTAEGMEDIGLVAEKEIENLLKLYKKNKVTGPILVVGHDSSGNSLYTVRAVKRAASLGVGAVFAINNPAKEVALVPRINNILRDKKIKKIHFNTDPPPVAGSTRLQPTTAGMAVFGYALARAFSLSFDKPEDGSNIIDSNIAAEALDWVKIIKKETPRLARFIDLKTQTYSKNHIFNSNNNPGAGYITFLAGNKAFLPVLTNEVEEYPTFGTPPYTTLKELNSGSQLSPSGILVDARTKARALNILFGRAFRGLDLKKLLSKQEIAKIYGSTKKIPDLSKKRLSDFPFDHKNVWKIRPTGKNNLVAAILMGDDVVKFNKKNSVIRQKLIKAGNNGAKTAIIAVTHHKINKKSWPKTNVSILFNVGSDPLSVRQSIVLKMLFNIQSNIVMAKLNKIYGSLMFDVAPSNGKLIDRATRYVIYAFRLMLKKKISYRTANRYLFEALDYIKKEENKNHRVSSPVKLAFLSCYKKIGMKEANTILTKHNGDLDLLLKAK